MNFLKLFALSAFLLSPMIQANLILQIGETDFRKVANGRIVNYHLRNGKHVYLTYKEGFYYSYIAQGAQAPLQFPNSTNIFVAEPSMEKDFIDFVKRKY